jgi:drug/metabolite transporter (DMT)-like permease
VRGPQASIPARTGVLILIGVASCFASNHLCARIAFDHGASVPAAVAVRATVTSLVLLVMMRLQRIPLAIPRAQRPAALFCGVLIAAQSYCLYSAVALVPPALALLVFQTSPMLYVLLTWALGKERPRWSALLPMALALAGLALALNLAGGAIDAQWAAVRTGVAWAFASGVCMSIVYYLNANALQRLDGRLRTFVMLAVTATLVIAGGVSAGAMVFPQGIGWLGLALLTLFYCVAMTSLFLVLPRLSPTVTAALNFEPIALLFLGWVFLGFSVTPLQLFGAFLVVGAIAWLGLSKRG